VSEEIPVTAPDPTPTDDVLRRAVAGDEAAFTALFVDLQPRLRRYAFALVREDADDVTAEAWLQIVRDLPRFTGTLDGFRGWCARIVRNRAVDLARSRARRPVRAWDDADTEVQAAADDTAADALERITTERAIRLIAGLPVDQAEAVLLRTVVGLDAATAADVLDKSPAAVRVAAHRGLKTLRRRLGTARREPKS
jgi:RNA polymerase sigma-70 factor (ECF subfamily)